MKPDYIFESERLGFRRWQEADKEPFAAMNQDPEVMQYFPDTLSKEESDLLIGRFEEHTNTKGYGIWAVERKEDQAFIGFIGLLDINMDMDFKGETEIGWRLDKRFWKKGYAVEGAKACLDYAFNHIGLNEVYSFTSVLNKPSETVMKRIGMVKAGEFEHPKIDEGNPLKEHVLYKISKTEKDDH